MNICISGSNGLIGRHLVPFLVLNGHNCILIERKTILEDFELLKEKIENSSAFINLSGYPINRFWTKSVKRKIIDSRVKTTNNIVRAIIEVEKSDYCYITASGINIYRINGIHSEESFDFDNGFLSKVVQEWEDASKKLPGIGVRRILLRLAPVIFNRFGIIDFLRLAGSFPVLIYWGNKNHRFSFIHIDDLLNIILLILSNNTINNVINAVAPSDESTKEVIRCLSRKKKVTINVPDWFIRLFLGESSQLIIWTAKVLPNKLIGAGFNFKYPSWGAILKDLKHDG